MSSLYILINMKPLTNFLLLFAILTLTTVSPAGAEGEADADCVRPGKTPSIPDARRSTEEDMKEAMSQIQDFLAAGSAYRECVNKLLEAGGDEVSENTRKAARYLIDESLETDELLGDLFNQQVRLFKSLNSEDY